MKAAMHKLKRFAEALDQDDSDFYVYHEPIHIFKLFPDHQEIIRALFPPHRCRIRPQYRFDLELDGKDVVEIGCNLGLLSSFYMRAYDLASLMSIDVSPTCCDVCETFADLLLFDRWTIMNKNAFVYVGEERDVTLIQDPFTHDDFMISAEAFDNMFKSMVDAMLEQTRPGGHVHVIGSGERIASLDEHRIHDAEEYEYWIER